MDDDKVIADFLSNTTETDRAKCDGDVLATKELFETLSANALRRAAQCYEDARELLALHQIYAGIAEQHDSYTLTA